MFGVDLLLFGHVHAYERTNPVSNYQADASGCSPVYITIGSCRVASACYPLRGAGRADSMLYDAVMGLPHVLLAEMAQMTLCRILAGGPGKGRPTCCRAIGHGPCSLVLASIKISDADPSTPRHAHAGSVRATTC